MMFFGLIMAEMRKKTTCLIFLLQMSTVTMAERQIEVISVIFVIFCAYFYFESRKKVEIG